jgi:hypothetical protein
MFTVLAALLLLAGAVPTAWAALTGLSQDSVTGEPLVIEPHGYPAWYGDVNGLKLELCLPAPAGNATREDLCLFDPLDPESALVVAGEGFWWLGEAHIELPNDGDALLVLAVESTFGGAEAPIDGQQISFGRTRIRVDTPVAGTYTVTHPYGTEVFVIGAADVEDGINYTADIGASNFLFPALGFRGTLAAFGPDQVGLLTWPDYQTNAALQVRAIDPDTGLATGAVLEQYVGDPNQAVPVTDGSAREIIFRVDGPAGSDLGGPGIDFVQTNLFSVMGKVFDESAVLVPHVFPGEPVKNLLAVGPVNRVEPFIAPDPSLGAVTGVDYNYSVGYPIWYQENLELDPLAPTIPGVMLTLCTPGDAMCISDPIDPNNADHTLLRTGGEGFWWSADARFDIDDDDRAQLVLGLEATFGGSEALIDGQQIAFGRVRIRVDTNATGAGTYRVTHPYGEEIFEILEADVADGINYTADIGIADPADPDFAFVGALYSDIGPSFLKWTTFVDPATLADGEPYPEPLLVTPNAADPTLNNYYVGNPGFEHEVVGSPFDTNFFRVEIQNGDGWDLVGETFEFAVSGKVYDPATFQFAINAAAPVALADAATLTLPQASIAIDVLANDTFDNTAPAILTLVVPPNDGTAVANNPAGTISYTPDAALAAAGGVDTFSYQISQTIGGTLLTSGNAEVTVTVIPVETLVVDRASLRSNNLRLDLRGTTNSSGPLTIYAGGDTNGTVLGTAAARNGRWSFRGTGTSVIDTITVATPNNATTVTSAVQVR